MSIVPNVLVNGKSANLKNAASDLENLENILSPTESIKFLVLNRGIKPVSQYPDKESFKKDYKYYCKGLRNWTLSQGVVGLQTSLDRGYSIQCSYNPEMQSRDINDCNHADIFTVDIDNWDSDNDCLRSDAVSLDRVLSCDLIKEYIQFYQLSLTQKSETHPNLHLFGIFNKTCTDSGIYKTFVTAFSQALSKQLGHSLDPCFANNSVQICFSGKGKTEIISHDAFVDIEAFSELYPDFWEPAIEKVNSVGNATPKKAPITHPESTNQSLLEHLKTAIIDGILGGDYFGIYSRLCPRHNFKVRSQSQVEGWNPFSESNSSGTSFTASIIEENLPPVWFSRGGIPEGIRDEINRSDGGDVISYLILLHRQNTIKSGRINPLAKYPLRRQYYEAYVDICRTFGIKPLPVKKGKDVGLEAALKSSLESFLELSPKYLKRAKWENQDEMHFHYFDFDSGIWSVSKSFKNIWAYSIQYYIDCPEAYIKNSKISDLIQNEMFKSTRLDSVVSRLGFDKSLRSHIIALKNGDYDTKNKVFTEGFDPDNYNVTRSEIYFGAGTGKGLEVLDTWLNSTYQEAEKKLIKAWIIANCQGIAKRTGKMLTIYGTPGTGKSTLLNLLKHCLANLACVVDGSSFLDKSNRFSGQQLDGINALLIDEFKADLDGWERLKKLTGNATSYLSIEKKGKTPYEAIFRAGITTTTQDNFRLPNSDDGGIRRRIIPIKHNPDMANPALKNIDEIICEPEIYEDIFLWAIAQDGEQAIKDIIYYAENEAKETLIEVVRDNDKTLEFISDCLEFTDNASDELTNVSIIEAYRLWVGDIHQEHYDRNDSRAMNKLSKLPQWIREKAQNKANEIYWSMCPEKGQRVRVTVSGVQYQGFRGVKFKDGCEFNPNTIQSLAVADF
jgi:phage/plasmid-associated DNA primase